MYVGRGATTDAITFVPVYSRECFGLYPSSLNDLSICQAVSLQSYAPIQQTQSRIMFHHIALIKQTFASRGFDETIIRF